MNVLSTSQEIAELVKNYIGQVTNDSREYRIVLPGLTSRIAEEVHSLLKNSDINSFLAVSATRQPSEDKHWLNPVSLTNIRIGSFVAVTDPGALAEVRDSIRGTGGTIRSVVYSEEWPWIDSGSEAFRFDSSFVPSIVERWTSDTEEQTWIKSMILQGLVPATVRLHNRSDVLLEDIIGGFDPSTLVELRSIREKVLFHCGIPLIRSDDLDARTCVRPVKRLVRKILDRAKKEPELRSTIIAKGSGEEKELPGLVDAIDDFFDGLAGYASLDGDLLALKDCWGKGENRLKNWRLLSYNRLIDLFEIDESPPVSVDCKWGTDGDIVVSEDRKALGCSRDSTVRIITSYSIPDSDFVSGSLRLQIKIRREVLADTVVTEKEGEIVSLIDLNQYQFTYKRRVPVSIVLISDTVDRGHDRLYLHCCGPDRPAFAIGIPEFWSAEAEIKTDEPAPAKRQQIDGPIRLCFLSVGGIKPTVRIGGDQELQVSIESGSAIWKLNDSINALHAPSGQIECSCEIDDRFINISLVSDHITRGEFTLEDEFRHAIIEGKTSTV
ncbi:MAG: hypothetical protein AB3N14_03740, partial [Flavobacteriaceae bacterium]